jgi:hypothetical protein
MALNLGSWLMALGSWLLAHGSWLLALSSWLMAHIIMALETLGSALGSRNISGSQAHGSWLMAPWLMAQLMAFGSWLIALGSWLMALGSETHGS